MSRNFTQGRKNSSNMKTRNKKSRHMRQKNNNFLNKSKKQFDQFMGMDSMMNRFTNFMNEFNPLDNFKNSLFDESDDDFEDEEDSMDIGISFDNKKNKNNQIKSNKNQLAKNKSTVITRSYVSKVDYTGGKPHQEFYKSQSINQYDNGHNIQEKQESYKNTKTGIEKAAFQKNLDDKGTKNIRQRNRNTGDQEEHTITKGINEGEISSFNKEYMDYRNKVGFQKNYEYLNRMDKKRLIEGKNEGNDMLNKKRKNDTPLCLPSTETIKEDDDSKKNEEKKIDKEITPTPNSHEEQNASTPNIEKNEGKRKKNHKGNKRQKAH